VIGQDFAEDPSSREREMEAILGIGILLAIWVIVIYGSSYFNQNIK
jgi:hypothetical protein